ncbi:hypothetical protein C9374_006134 [Naegleria lovaniensis]|uniref:Glutamyl-tRNA(Gln) amidotransferase subunit B, mitochondrial n=1 Tax=Naegleria lovaniensis TaxID=51637 RepID=A0AA88GPL9_NAELO|nr:uncharacterized protein C9374_006134 [Naegleria lovaniensis]KAG2381750.1 hypothetical protein C9374_006134 [Naegleria lovaniensis]
MKLFVTPSPLALLVHRTHTLSKFYSCAGLVKRNGNLSSAFSDNHLSKHNCVQFHNNFIIGESIKERRRKEYEQHTSKKYLHTSGDESVLKGYRPVIGLEIHAQITSNSKLFSSGSTEFTNSTPNVHVTLFDASFPGTLPILNEFCIRQAVKTGLAIGGKVNLYSQFDRKHYFYPDLPLGYQITQQFYPLISEGKIRIDIPQGDGTYLAKYIRIARIQVEQDSGKSIHDVDYTLIDLNRAGNPLMEIITYPDINSSLEAELFVKKLQFLLRYIGTCDGNMEEGSLRCDVNVSVYNASKNEEPLSGTRCEVKNISSANNIPRAIDFEIKRHIELLTSGQKVEQQTRTFDAKKGETILLRSKENIPDYKFFPDPDLPYVELTNEYVQDIANSITSLPDQVIEKLTNEPYNLTFYDANVLLTTEGGVEFFEGILNDKRWRSETMNPKLVANWIASELMGLLNAAGLSLKESPVSCVQIGSIVDAIQCEDISGKMAKKIIKIMFDEKSGEMANDIAEKNGWKQITDRDTIASWCVQVIEQYPKEVESIKKGKDNSFQFLVAQVMKLSKGNASPSLVNQILRENIQ